MEVAVVGSQGFQQRVVKYTEKVLIGSCSFSGQFSEWFGQWPGGEEWLLKPCMRSSLQTVPFSSELIFLDAGLVMGLWSRVNYLAKPKGEKANCIQTASVCIAAAADLTA